MAGLENTLLQWSILNLRNCILIVCHLEHASIAEESMRMCLTEESVQINVPWSFTDIAKLGPGISFFNDIIFIWKPPHYANEKQRQQTKVILWFFCQRDKTVGCESNPTKLDFLFQIYIHVESHHVIIYLKTPGSATAFHAVVLNLMLIKSVDDLF